jgi:long-chain acyl-CoA synthetase
MIEGYGLTETSGGITCTKPSDTLAGHVGGPKPALKLRLKDAPDLNYYSTDKPYPRGEI